MVPFPGNNQLYNDIFLILVHLGVFWGLRHNFYYLGFRTAGAVVSFYELKMFFTSCILVWVIETALMFISSEISMTYLKNIITSLYIRTFLELLNKWGKNQVRKIFYSPFSLSQIFQLPTQLSASTAAELQVCLCCFYIPKVSSPHKLSF